MGVSENIINTNKWGWDSQLELAISKNKFAKSKLNLWKTPLVSNFKLYCSIITLRSNHLYLIDLLTKCFKQLDKCFS